ncbi:MAG: LVIVD repeat-containing protein [Actinomycetota bacterium]|nr:hypothetical protein [Actinomycetota bacterium]
MKRSFPAAVTLVLVLAAPFAAKADPGSTAGFTTVPPRPPFTLVGHDPLYGRGMNAAPAIYKNWMYVGNRTDGSPHHPHPGVLVVDISDPGHPFVFSEIGAPDEGAVSETSRELRVWPEQNLLMVMNFTCSAIIHACTSAADAAGSLTPNIKFYDLSGDNAGSPKLIATYVPPPVPLRPQGVTVPGQSVPVTPHEMFLWVDPKNPGRALLYYTGPTTSLTRPNLVITDISKAREGKFTDVAQWKGTDLFPQDVLDNNDVRLHSIGVSTDGKRTYLAYLGGGFLVLDTSDFAKNTANPTVKLVTPIANRVPSQTAIGTHSSVKLPGRPYVLTTDEVYGQVLNPAFGEHGCPWGWVRIIDVSDEAHPKIVSEFKQAQNDASYCDSPDGQDPQNVYFTSFASHNPTLTRNLAFITWHSDGLIAVDISDPVHPTQAGAFKADPLASVATEDPALSMGREKVVAWSYPIIKDGLIYFVDVRNGLYVVRYNGPYADEVSGISFLEGNSNLGNARELDLARYQSSHRTAVRGLRQTRTSLPLPSTGVDDGRSFAALLLAIAVALATRMRRIARH